MKNRLLIAISARARGFEKTSVAAGHRPPPTAEPARRRHKGKPRAGSARPWWTVAVAVLVALLGAAALVVAGSANQAPPNHFRDARVDASSGHGGA